MKPVFSFLRSASPMGWLPLFFCAGMGALQAETIHCAYTANVLAGKNTPVAKLSVGNTANDLVVHVDALPPWRVKAIHVYANPSPLMPQAGQGIAPHQFPYKTPTNSGASQRTLRIPLHRLHMPSGNLLYMAVHAEMTQGGGESSNYSQETESGWAFGPLPFGGGTGGWSFTYMVCKETTP